MSGEGESPAGGNAPKPEDPPSFEEDPAAAYKYLQDAYEGLRESRSKYKENYLKVSAANKTLRGLLSTAKDAMSEEEERRAAADILSVGSDQKGPSRVPPYMGTEGGHSAQIWLTGLEKLQGIQKWSPQQTLDAADLALFGIAAEWKTAQRAKNSAIFTDLALFKKEFLKRFAIQQSSVESIKLVMDLKQKPSEKV